MQLVASRKRTKISVICAELSMGIAEEAKISAHVLLMDHNFAFSHGDNKYVLLAAVSD